MYKPTLWENIALVVVVVASVLSYLLARLSFEQTIADGATYTAIVFVVAAVIAILVLFLADLSATVEGLVVPLLGVIAVFLVQMAVAVTAALGSDSFVADTIGVLFSLIGVILVAAGIITALIHKAWKMATLAYLALLSVPAVAISDMYGGLSFGLGGSALAVLGHVVLQVYIAPPPKTA